MEYCPCVVATDCWNLVMEFMQSFMGNHAPGIPSVFSNKHDSIYSPADTIVQYMELFNKIRKQQQVPVAGIRWRSVRKCSSSKQPLCWIAHSIQYSRWQLLPIKAICLCCKYLVEDECCLSSDSEMCAIGESSHGNQYLYCYT